MAKKGEYRGLYVALIDSWEFQELSACARSCFYTLKLSLGLAGINVFNPETLPRYTGFQAAECEAAIDELIERRWLVVERNVFWLRNGLRFEPTEPLASPNGRTGIINHLGTLPSLPIVVEFAQYYGLVFGAASAEETSAASAGDRSPFEAPSKPLTEPLRSTETETETETDTDTETEKTILKLHARDAIEASADDIIRAANRGMIDNPAIGDAANPIPIGHSSRQCVLDWLADGIPADRIIPVVEDRARTWKRGGHRKQITTMTYFDAAVRDEWERLQAKEAGNGRNRNGGPAGAAALNAGAGGGKPSKFAHLVEG